MTLMAHHKGWPVTTDVQMGTGVVNVKSLVRQHALRATDTWDRKTNAMAAWIDTT